MIESVSTPRFSPAEVRQIDRTCDRFESALKVGARPDVTEFLGNASEPLRSALLRQLLLLDLDYARHRGKSPRVEDYLTRFPDDTALIANVCREANEAPSHSLRDPADAPPAPDAIAARYDLMNEIGHGGIGVVYRGRDRTLQRELAIKILRESYQHNREAQRRFVEEARVGSRLQHPAIVPVHELGWFADGRPYFTMKLVEGNTLAELLRGRGEITDDLPRFVGVFQQVCQAHADGVTTPSNFNQGPWPGRTVWNGCR